jgi:hypothetical protein
MGKASPVSGAESPPFVALPDALVPMLDTIRALVGPDVPPIALVGGLAVNLRLATGGGAHRATRDIDVVSGDDVPGVIDVLGAGDPMDRAQTVHVGEFDVDVIATVPVGSDELDGLDDANRLFFVGHRWAFDTATAVRLGTRDRTDLVDVPVATPAGLVAAKSHAIGHPRSIRRATKHAGDLYDVFRLLEVFDADGSIADEIARAPHGLGALIAGVLRTEILDNPAKAAHQMSIASTELLDADRVTDAVEPFAAAITA